MFDKNLKVEETKQAKEAVLKEDDGKEQKKITYCGMALSKVDIEDLLQKFKPPREPGPDDCCWGRCNPCVYDRYD